MKAASLRQRVVLRVSAVKRLETERLWLDDWRADDAGPLAAMNADPEVMRHIGAGPRAPAEALAEARAFLATPRPGPLGRWAVRNKAGGAFLGMAGLFPLDGGEEIELAYRLVRAAWSRGLASEAARRLLAYGFDEAGLERLVAVTDRRNARSQRVLVKLGFRYRGLRRVYNIDDVWWYDLTARHWRWLAALPGGAG